MDKNGKLSSRVQLSFNFWCVVNPDVFSVSSVPLW